MHDTFDRVRIRHLDAAARQSARDDRVSYIQIAIQLITYALTYSFSDIV